MRKDWIRKRQRKAQQISGIMKLANQTIAPNIPYPVVENPSVDNTVVDNYEPSDHRNQNIVYEFNNTTNYTLVHPMPVQTNIPFENNHSSYYALDGTNYSSSLNYSNSYYPADVSGSGYYSHAYVPSEPSLAHSHMDAYVYETKMEQNWVQYSID